jgi:hypothetical protein
MRMNLLPPGDASPELFTIAADAPAHAHPHPAWEHQRRVRALSLPRRRADCVRQPAPQGITVLLLRMCSLTRCCLECVLLLNQRHKVLPRMCSLTRCHLERVLLPDVALKCVL